MRLLALLLLSLLAPILRAVDDGVQDLGEGLGYVRIAQLDTAVVPPPARALVIDLRQATFTAPAAVEKLKALLATDGPPRFVLVSATTPPALLALLDARAPAVLTLGAASPALSPDIAVGTTPEEDRRAYEALVKGAPLAAVVRPSVEKERYDEAAMMRDHANGVPVPDSPPPVDAAAPAPAAPPAPAAEATPGEGADKAKPAPPPVDAVLQRAMQIYQGLKALKKA